MGINIEFNTDDITPPELDALAALIAVLAGRHPGGKSLLEVAGLGTDADRPKPVVAPPPPAVTNVTNIVADKVDEEREPVVGPNDGALPPSPAEGLLAAEAARVAAATRPEGVDLDVNGIPWDARIHASTKAKNKDDSWRNKPKVDPAVLADVTAQLKALMALPVPEAAAIDPAAAFGGAPVEGPLPISADNADTGSGALAADGASSEEKPLFERMAEAAKASTAVAAPPPPAATEAASPSMTDFARVMRVVAAKQAAGTLSTELVASLCASLGLTGVRDLAARPDMIPAFEALLP